VNRSAGTAAVVPSAVVTWTSTVVPLVPAGLVAVQVVPSTTHETAVAGLVPKLTVGGVPPGLLVSPVPVMVTFVPPTVSPVCGATSVTTGAFGLTGAAV
jgi:hypothetical protein